ncbi:MAG TPA: EAL domain-containing protein [Desulfobacteraceae bacterium]|nr:EAL domain-containing protein [Desulfobacteraceae bacterium]
MAERSKEYLLHQQILIEAIEKEEFYLFYQPIYNLKQKRFEGVEGLLRILKEDGGYYSPEKIIEAARDLGVQTELTKKILERGLVDLKELLKRFGEMTMAINVLAQDLSDEAFLTYLEELLVKHDLSPRYLALEITEKELISNYEEIKPRLRKIEKMGISIEIDDFGMAHSNFRQVISIDFHLLKIDKSLIDEIIVDAKSSEIVGFLILFARDFGMKSLAEGVETKEQVEILEEMGCDYIQGFYYAKPMPKGDLRKIFVNL